MREIERFRKAKVGCILLISSICCVLFVLMHWFCYTTTGRGFDLLMDMLSCQVVRESSFCIFMSISVEAVKQHDPNQMLTCGINHFAKLLLVNMSGLGLNEDCSIMIPNKSALSMAAWSVFGTL